MEAFIELCKLDLILLIIDASNFSKLVHLSNAPGGRDPIQGPGESAPMSGMFQTNWSWVPTELSNQGLYRTNID
jgi:hypothetical protein